jgi:myo-inositol-1(or 4)-monophosphatase
MRVGNRRARLLRVNNGLRDDLETLLADAGEVALRHFRNVVPEWKADGTPVTEADRAVEELIVERLVRWFPGDGVRSEEGTRVEGRPGSATWYVDPIDGTGGYVAGLTDWGPTVCRVEDGQLQVGAFYVPRLRELWYAEAGGGAFRDGVRLGPAEDRAVRGDDLMFVPSRFHRRGPVPWPGKVRALGSSAAHLCHVAAGAGLATIIPKWNLWDVGAGTLLLREVGMLVLGADGQPLAPERSPEGLPLVAGAPNAMRVLFTDGWATRALGGGT